MMLAIATRLGLIALVLLAFGCNKQSGTEAPKHKTTPKSTEPTAKVGKKAKTTEKAKTVEKAPTKAAIPAPTHKGPIARINGVELSSDEFNAKYAKMTKAFTTRKKDIPEGLSKRYKESILKQLVDKELLRQKIKSEGITIDAESLAKELEDYKKMFRTEENFQRYLKSSDITLDAIKGNIKHNLAVTKLLEKSGDLAITDTEIKEYYKNNEKRYEVKEQVRASHILFKVSKKDPKKTDAEAKKKADSAYKEATKKGADFAALAKKLSEGPTGPRGGDLSFFTRGRMVPEFEKVAFTMKKDQISKPIKTQFGWHVIKVTDKKEGRKRPFAEVKESIDKLLRNKKSRKAKAGLLKTLKDGAKIETLIPGLDAKTAGKPKMPTAIKTAIKPGAKLKKAPGIKLKPADKAVPAGK